MSDDKRKCFLLLPRPVFPTVSGYSLKNYNLIRILSEKYALTVGVISSFLMRKRIIIKAWASVSFPGGSPGGKAASALRWGCFRVFRCRSAITMTGGCSGGWIRRQLRQTC